MQIAPNNTGRSRRFHATPAFASARTRALRLSTFSSRALRGASTSIVGAALLGALSGCGGVIKFADSTPIAIRGPAPAVVAEVPKRVEVKADRIEITEK